MTSNSKWIRIERPFSLPGYVKEALDLLDHAGFVAYVVGGSVRDFLLQKKTKDFDIATSAHPEEIEALFPKHILVGKAFGVIKVPVADSSAQLEIATFREDADYQDHRRPKKVTFSGAEEDAHRRDFTMNALYYDPKSQRIFDPTGGIQDLESGVVRAIGDPRERFKEDALRLLRAVRFTTRFSFELDSVTALAVKERAKLLAKVSAERIRDELTAMWTGSHASDALEMLSQLGLLEQVSPEIEELRRAKPQLWSHTLKLMAALEKQKPSRSAVLAWGAVLSDLPEKIRDITERLKMSRSEIQEIELLVSNAQKFREVFKMREATLQRFIREPGFEQWLELHHADSRATDGNLAYFEFAQSRWNEAQKEPGNFSQRFVDGQDLIQLGLQPGPEFSGILRTIEDLALEKKIHSKEEALEYVIKNFVK